MLCGGILGLSIGVMHVLAQLDNAAAIAPGLAVSIYPAVYAIAGATLLRIPHPGTAIGGPGKSKPTLEYLYPAFTAVSAAAIVLMIGIALVSLHHFSDLFESVHARPR